MTSSPAFSLADAARSRFSERTARWGGGWRRWVFPGIWLVYPRRPSAGVTNVVRHSRASRCVITLGPRWIEIVDDGRGGVGGTGRPRRP
jgi:hypothetical protein